VVFQSPLLLRTVDLAKVINARILLRGGTRTDEIGNGDRCQQPDDRNHDHDFYQREATLARFIDSHTALIAFLLYGVNSATGGLNNDYPFTYCLVATVVKALASPVPTHSCSSGLGFEYERYKKKPEHISLGFEG
jgi:hypothetical protein